FPSGLNLKTCCPMGVGDGEGEATPRAGGEASPSVTQMFPAGSTWIPCGYTNRPAPKLFTRRPDASNLRMGSRFEPTHVPSSRPGVDSRFGALHRSNTQRLLPSRSMSMPAAAPIVLPAGSLKKSSMVRYGFGGELG